MRSEDKLKLIITNILDFALQLDDELASGLEFEDYYKMINDNLKKEEYGNSFMSVASVSMLALLRSFNAAHYMGLNQEDVEK